MTDVLVQNLVKSSHTSKKDWKSAYNVFSTWDYQSQYVEIKLYTQCVQYPNLEPTK